MTTTRIADPEQADIPIAYPPAPNGQLLYVIGDIHGRRDLLERVHRVIDEDKVRARSASPPELAGCGTGPTRLVKPHEDANRPAGTGAMLTGPAALLDKRQPQVSDAQAVSSAIGADLRVKGRIKAKHDVHIDGHVCGDVHATRIVVGRDASIEGSLIAGDVFIGGSVLGTIRCNSLTLETGARVKADVLYTTLSVEEGCVFEGKSRQSRDPLSERQNVGLLPLQEPAALEIYVGDYIDRGDDSRGVVELLIERAQQTNTVFLRGNHEQFMLDFMAGTMDFSIWKQVGAVATLRSYGVQASQFGFSAPQNTVRSALKQAIDARHARFFNDTIAYFVAGQYLFVHAGVRPGIPLEEQQPIDLMGIRQQFLEFEGSFEHIVVHGHTPTQAPEFRRNRINVDTAAYSTGRLTCLRIGGDGPRVLEVS
jgi:serine/threonine protein phosphatase 1